MSIVQCTDRDQSPVYIAAIQIVSIRQNEAGQTEIETRDGQTYYVRDCPERAGRAWATALGEEIHGGETVGQPVIRNVSEQERQFDGDGVLAVPKGEPRHTGVDQNRPDSKPHLSQLANDILRFLERNGGTATYREILDHLGERHDAGMCPTALDELARKGQVRERDMNVVLTRTPAAE